MTQASLDYSAPPENNREQEKAVSRGDGSRHGVSDQPDLPRQATSCMSATVHTRVSDLERLRQRLLQASGPISMWDLRLEFPGGLTQRITELKRQGLPVKCIEGERVDGKRRTAYVIEREA